jgi:Rrf2 family protein
MRAVLYIARNSQNGEKVGITDISEALEIPKHYLAKILQQLSGRDVIQSIKGPGGGFYLTKAASKQTLLKVIDVLDGEEVFQRCAIGLEECSDDRPCAIHRYIVPFRDAFYSAVRNITIDDLQRDIERGETFITNFGRFNIPKNPEEE